MTVTNELLRAFWYVTPLAPVVTRHFMPLLQQQFGYAEADIACPANDDHAHEITPVFDWLV